MNPDGVLAKIAAGMMRYAALEPNRKVRHFFSKGAKLVVYMTSDHEWHLLIGRDNAPPSPNEVATFRAAFGVPKEVESQRMSLNHVRVVWKV